MMSSVATQEIKNLNFLKNFLIAFHPPGHADGHRAQHHRHDVLQESPPVDSLGRVQTQAKTDGKDDRSVT